MSGLIKNYCKGALIGGAACFTTALVAYHYDKVNIDNVLEGKAFKADLNNLLKDESLTLDENSFSKLLSTAQKIFKLTLLGMVTTFGAIAGGLTGVGASFCLSLKNRLCFFTRRNSGSNIHTQTCKTTEVMNRYKQYKEAK